jgi:RES domain-containing protein
MIVYRISNCKYIDDLSGQGAALYGGRWNSEGVYLLYTAGSGSLAMLESLVHFGGRIIGDYCQVVLQLPDEAIKEIPGHQLPLNWREHPPPDLLKAWGDQFSEEGSYLALKVPSVLVPQEFNYLLNPSHPAFKKIKVVTQDIVRIDERLLKGN